MLITSSSKCVKTREQLNIENAYAVDRCLQIEKMVTIGTLAIRIAHDFNNMISVIMNQAEMTMTQLEPGSQIYSELNVIYNAAEHSANLTRFLLPLARQQANNPRLIDLVATIKILLKILDRLIDKQIRIFFLPENGTWSIHINPVEINRILINLCINASDSITGSGITTIKTSNVNSDNISGLHDLPPCDYVLVSVSDTGCGMDEETLAKIFDSFFTTKPSGAGIGLGLSTVLEIIIQNRGIITVNSELKKGTTFNIYLPRY